MTEIKKIYFEISKTDNNYLCNIKEFNPEKSKLLIIQSLTPIFKNKKTEEINFNFLNHTLKFAVDIKTLIECTHTINYEQTKFNVLVYDTGLIVEVVLAIEKIPVETEYILKKYKFNLFKGHFDCLILHNYYITKENCLNFITTPLHLTGGTVLDPIIFDRIGCTDRFREMYKVCVNASVSSVFVMEKNTTIFFYNLEKKRI